MVFENIRTFPNLHLIMNVGHLLLRSSRFKLARRRRWRSISTESWSATDLHVLQKTSQGAFKEASEQECTLPEEDPRLFGYFVEDMYREGRLHENNTNTNHFHCSKFLTLARLYTMRDRFLAKSFQNLTLLELGSALSSGPDL
jgi:hypothetical protein